MLPVFEIIFCSDIHLALLEVNSSTNSSTIGTQGTNDNVLHRYVKDPMQEGDVFGSKDFFTGLAVIMDTYSNHNGPHNVRCCI